MHIEDRSNPSRDPIDIYRDLERGIGHELVDDRNVHELIAMAELRGNALIARMLREWHAPCSDGSEGVPSTIAPTRGFNREHVKR